MDAIAISVMVGEDRRLVIDLPAHMPVGPAELVIRPREIETTKSAETKSDVIVNPAHEAARAKLLAAGILSTAHRAPDGAAPLSDEEMQRLGQRPPGSKSLDELINEDRVHY
jgi:hypothetical protein